MILPVALPKSLRLRALRPDGLSPGELAWSRNDAYDVLSALANSTIAVIGVDAYGVPFGQHLVIPTGRRAVYAYAPGELALDFARRSRQMAEVFIRAGSPDELFVLNFSGQDDAEAGHGVFKVQAG